MWPLAGLSAQEYTIRQGDTLYSLARRYGVSVSEIMKVNSLQSSTELKPGMVLQIPAKNLQDVAQNTGGKTAKGFTAHVVAKGETLYAIARKYGMTVGNLLKINDLSSGAVLKPGQNLIVKAAEKHRLASEGELAQSVNAVGRGSYFWPVAGRRERVDGKLRGVRILAEDQSLVYAVRAGKVMWQGPYRSYGTVVLIADRDSYVYLYGGNVHFLTNVGQDIAKGEPIAKVDATVGNQLAGQSQAYQGENEELAAAKRYPSQVYFSVFRNGVFVPVERAPRN